MVSVKKISPLVIAALASSSVSLYGSEKMNVVIIISDDQGYGDFSINGNEYLATPHIDELARESVSLDRFMMCAVSAPSRAAFYTGRYPLSTGVTWVTRRKEVMNSGEVTIGELFKENGYRTGLFGKWHNGSQYPHNPVGQGFDDFVGFCAGHTNNYFDTTLEQGSCGRVETKGYIADVLTSYAIDFIERDDQSPFLCVLPVNTPHAPFQVESKYYDKYAAMGLDPTTASVYGMCENLDDNVGRVIEALKKSGKWDNTILVFTTDNGPNTYRYNSGMKGKKAELYEGGVRVPLYIRIPNQEPCSVAELTANIDIMPTLASLCGVSIPEVLDIHGRDLTSLIKGEDKEWESRIIYAHNQPWEFEKWNAAAIHTDEHSLIYTRTGDTVLFNMSHDYAQQNNIIEENPEIVADLSAKYDAWFNEMTNGGAEPLCEPIEIGHSQAPCVVLPVVDGKTINKVRYSSKGWSNDWVYNFRTKKGAVEWECKIVEDGEYDVEVLYSYSPQFEGFDMVVEGQGKRAKATPSPYVTVMKESPDRVQRGEVYEYSWAKLPVGKMTLTRGTAKIKVRIDGEDINPENDLRVLELRFIKR